MRIKFSDLKTFENIGNVVVSNILIGFKHTPKKIEIERDYALGKTSLSQLIQISKDGLYV